MLACDESVFAKVYTNLGDDFGVRRLSNRFHMAGIRDRASEILAGSDSADRNWNDYSYPRHYVNRAAHAFTKMHMVPLSTSDPVAWSAAHHVYSPPFLANFFDFFHQNYIYKTSVTGVPVYYLNR